jgi:hypothetical protein
MSVGDMRAYVRELRLRHSESTKKQPAPIALRESRKGELPPVNVRAALREVGESAFGMSPAAARVFAQGRSRLTEVEKTVGGLTASCFAWTPDLSDSSTWKMQICRSADGDWSPSEDLVRAAVAQLPGVAAPDKALDIPETDLPQVKAVLRSAWIACGAPIDEMDPVLNESALARAFTGLGLSEDTAAVAARGRQRRI